MFKKHSLKLIAIFVILLISLLAVTAASADGGDCPDNDVGSRTGTGNLVTYTNPDGLIIDAVCIKSGSGMWGGEHSGWIGNGPIASCYTVSGVGTSTVTVEKTGTPGPECQDISHIDIKLTEPPENTPTPTDPVENTPTPTEVDPENTPTPTDPGSENTPTPTRQPGPTHIPPPSTPGGGGDFAYTLIMVTLAVIVIVSLAISKLRKRNSSTR